MDCDRDRRPIAIGCTNPTYRNALRAIEEHWAEFRRALRRRDRPRFDRLFEYTREYALLAAFENVEEVAELMREDGYGELD